MKTHPKELLLATATAAADGSFSIVSPLTKHYHLFLLLPSKADLDESAAIQINVAAPSAAVAQDKLSYSISNGTGTLIGSASYCSSKCDR